MANQIISARVVQGHRVASGLNGNPRFPGGTLRMQAPHFLERGLDISKHYVGTLNVSIAPNRFKVLKPKWTFTHVKWHPIEPAEDFSFFDVWVFPPALPAAAGLIYYPHPETKPEHFQKPDVLELLLPHIENVAYGMELKLQLATEQILIEPQPAKLTTAS